MKPKALPHGGLTTADLMERVSPWLDASAAAVYCRCSRKTLQRAVAAGQLRAVRLAGNRRFRFRSEWLDAWLEGHLADDTSGRQPANDPATTGTDAGPVRTM